MKKRAGHGLAPPYQAGQKQAPYMGACFFASEEGKELRKRALRRVLGGTAGKRGRTQNSKRPHAGLRGTPQKMPTLPSFAFFHMGAALQGTIYLHHIERRDARWENVY